MKISFDLDDLLIPGVKTFPVEQKRFIHTFFRTENLRKGTPELFRRLKKDGHELCIYTTSLRSIAKVKRLFFLHGIALQSIYNKTSHDKEMKAYGFSCSKYPPMFGIDLHIDDSPGVKVEAERYKFKALIIDEKDVAWIGTVLDFIKHAEIDHILT